MECLTVSVIIFLLVTVQSIRIRQGVEISKNVIPRRHVLSLILWQNVIIKKELYEKVEVLTFGTGVLGLSFLSVTSCLGGKLLDDVGCGLSKENRSLLSRRLLLFSSCDGKKLPQLSSPDVFCKSPKTWSKSALNDSACGSDP